MIANFIRELFRRRVPQILGIYIGVCWGAVQAVDWATSRYLLSTHLVDLVVFGTLSLLPAVLVLAYMHGAPGRDRWTRLEKWVVPANLCLTALLLGSQVQGKDLGRVAEKVEITDEAGQTVERLVPKLSARRKVALFFWKNASGDSELDWLQEGFPTLLEQDLDQDLFLSTITPAQRSLLAGLQNAGFEDGLGAPVSLQRQVAKRHGRQYFVSGEFDRVPEGFQAELTIYSTDPAREVGRHEVKAADPMDLVDLATVAIKPDLGVHKGADQLADDLPVAEHFSGELGAVRNLVEATRALSLSNDYPTAIAGLQEAVELDPSFAAAHLDLARAHYVAGNVPGAQSAIEQARKHEYRLGERSRYSARAMGHQLRQEYDRVIPLHEQWVKLYPDDVVALAALGNAYVSVDNQVDKALATFRRLLELSPEEDKTLLSIAQLLQTQGEYPEALGYLERYSEAHPESEDPHLMMGQLHWKLGEHAEAQTAFEKASLLVPDQVGPQVLLGLVEMAEGKVAEAEERYRRAAEDSTTPADKFAAVQNLLGCHFIFGKTDRLAEILPDFFDLGSKFMPPVQLLPTKAAYMLQDHIARDQLQDLPPKLDALKAQLAPPFDVLIEAAYIDYYLETDQPDAAQATLEKFQNFLDTSRLEILSYLSSSYSAKIAAHRGEHARAAELFQQAEDLHGRSVLSNMDLLSPLDYITRKGQALALAGDEKGAELALRETLRRFPAYPTAHLEMAKLYRDDPAQAQEHLGRLFELLAEASPTFPPLVEARELESTL